MKKTDLISKNGLKCHHQGGNAVMGNFLSILPRFMIFMVFLLTYSFSGIQAQCLTGAGAAIFQFRANSDVLRNDYQTNQNALGYMTRLLATHADSIRSGYSHLVLTSYICPSETENLAALNNAAVQASVVRAYVRTKYHLETGSFIFLIDNTKEMSNSVRLDFVKGAASSCVGSELYYTLERTPARIRYAVSRYTHIPFIGEMDVFCHQVYYHDRYDSDMDTYMDISPEAVAVRPELSRTSEKKATADLPVKAAPADVPAAPAVSKAEASTNPSFLPSPAAVRKDYLGIGTNLLYLCGLTPNLMAEFYFGNAFSIYVEGAYAAWQKGGNAPKTWNVSTYSAEARYWLWGSGYNYRGHYVGLYGHGGSYDFMFDNAHGYLGSYLGGGLSYGFVFGLSRNLVMETGLRVGYVRSPTDFYHAEEGEFYKDKHRNMNYIGPTGLHVSLIYRIGK